jgi:hypothetical protein
MSFVVRLSSAPDLWLAVWPGDPGRTYVLRTARTYKTRRGAKGALTRARSSGRMFPQAEILELAAAEAEQPKDQPA